VGDVDTPLKLLGGDGIKMTKRLFLISTDHSFPLVQSKS
jgi:hypothetical protein